MGCQSTARSGFFSDLKVLRLCCTKQKTAHSYGYDPSKFETKSPTKSAFTDSNAYCLLAIFEDKQDETHRDRTLERNHPGELADGMPQAHSM